MLVGLAVHLLDGVVVDLDSRRTYTNCFCMTVIIIVASIMHTFRVQWSYFLCVVCSVAFHVYNIMRCIILSALKLWCCVLLSRTVTRTLHINDHYLVTKSIARCPLFWTACWKWDSPRTEREEKELIQYVIAVTEWFVALTMSLKRACLGGYWACGDSACYGLVCHVHHLALLCTIKDTSRNWSCSLCSLF